jgi:hypothetical protein
MIRNMNDKEKRNCFLTGIAGFEKDYQQPASSKGERI